jgi:hypothetical protein
VSRVDEQIGIEHCAMMLCSRRRERRGWTGSIAATMCIRDAAAESFQPTRTGDDRDTVTSVWQPSIRRS